LPGKPLAYLASLQVVKKKVFHNHGNSSDHDDSVFTSTSDGHLKSATSGQVLPHVELEPADIADVDVFTGFIVKKTNISWVYFLVRWRNGAVSLPHRHLSNINCLTVHTTCLVGFIGTVNGCCKKKKKKRRQLRPAPVALSNLFGRLSISMACPHTGQSTLPLGDINICLLWQ